MDGIGLFFSATCVMSGRLETIEALVWGWGRRCRNGSGIRK